MYRPVSKCPEMMIRVEYCVDNVERLLVTSLIGNFWSRSRLEASETRSWWTGNRYTSILVGFRQLCANIVAFPLRRETECRYAKASNRAYVKKSLTRKKDSLCLSSSFSSSTSTSAINACHNIGSAVPSFLSSFAFETPRLGKLEESFTGILKALLLMSLPTSRNNENWISLLPRRSDTLPLSSLLSRSR